MAPEAFDTSAAERDGRPGAVVVREPAADCAPGDLVRHRGRVWTVRAVWQRVNGAYETSTWLELAAGGRETLVRVGG